MSCGIAPTSPTQSRNWITIAFVAFVAAYVIAATALRGQFDLRYDDTLVVHSHLLGSADNSENIDRLANQICSVGYWQKLWLPGSQAPANAATYRPHSFRPLQLIYHAVASLLYFRCGAWLPYLMCFLLLGLSSYLIFRLFQEVGSVQLAAICAAAYLFFPAVVSPAWNPLAGPQSIIPGAYAAAMLAYLRYLRTGRARYLAVIAVVCVVGPWYKETIGAAAILLLAHQLFVAPAKRWGLIAGLALACVHGIFPETAIRLVFARQLYLLSIFDCGALHDHAIAQTWRPEFPTDLVALVSPTLLLVSLASIVVGALLRKPVARFALPAWLTRCALPLLRGALLLLAPAAIVFLVALIAGHPVVPLASAALAAFAAIALYGLLYIDALIAGWFCCMFLPLMRIYFNSTQCGYVAAPLIYLSVAPIFPCWEMLAAGKAAMPLRAALKYALVAIGLMAFCDNALSLPNAWIAYHKTGQFNDEILSPELHRALTQPQGVSAWTFIQNTIVVDDAVILATRFHAGHGTFNFDNGVPPSQVLRTEQDIQGLLRKYNCVLVIADHTNPFLHTFWNIHSIEKLFRKTGDHQINFTAYYVDPLRYLIDNRSRSMMGPPDFQYEFAKQTLLFQEQFTNHYNILVREKGPADLAGLGLMQR